MTESLLFDNISDMYKITNQEKELLRRKRISETMKRKGLTPPKYTWCKKGNKLGKGNKGKPKSEEHRKNIGKALTGRHLSKEHRQKSIKGLIHNFGKNSAHWKGGKSFSNGYILIFSPNHPYRSKKNYLYEQRLVAEKYLNRYLTKQERLHHINGIKTDNRPENLYLFSSQFHHSKFHNLKNKTNLISNIFPPV